MIARAGASVTLSFVVVASAAIALHRPDRPPLAMPSRQTDAGPVAESSPSPIVTPGIAWEEPRRTPSRSERIEAPARVERKPPEGSFAKVLTRETLGEFSLRIYGDPGLAKAVWEANRDRVPLPDSTLRSGMILRTPVLP